MGIEFRVGDPVVELGTYNDHFRVSEPYRRLNKPAITGNPKFETFTDDFSNGLDAWTIEEEAPSIVDGKAVLDKEWVFITVPQLFNGIDTSIHFQILPGVGEGWEAYFYGTNSLDVLGGFGAELSQSGDEDANLSAWIYGLGVDDGAFLSSIPYDSVNHTWMRFRSNSDGSVLYFETAATLDGTWTTLLSNDIDPAHYTDVKIGIEGYTWGTNPVFPSIDNINTVGEPPSEPEPSTPEFVQAVNSPIAFSTTRTAPAVTDTVAGDVLVAIAATTDADITTPGVNSITPPAGRDWTFIGAIHSDAYARIEVFTKIATGSEPAGLWTFPYDHNGIVGIVAYRNAQSPTAIAGSAEDNATSITIPAVTVPDNNIALYFAYSHNRGAVTISGVTERTNVTNGSAQNFYVGDSEDGSSRVYGPTGLASIKLGGAVLLAPAEVVGGVTIEASGSSTGISTVVGTSSKTVDSGGNVSGISTVVGTSSKTVAASGSSTGTSTVDGSSSRIVNSGGNVSGTSSVDQLPEHLVGGFPIIINPPYLTGGMFRVRNVDSTVTGTSTVVGDATKVGTTLPKIETLVADFDSGTIEDNGFYVHTVYYSGSPSIVGGQLRTPSSKVDSISNYDLTDSAIFGKFTGLPNDGSFRFILYSGNSDGGKHIQFNLIWTGIFTLEWSNYPHGDSSQSITYNATEQAYWRIRESAGTLYWDTSPDGQTWTTRRSSSSASTGLDLTNLTVRFYTSGSAVFTDNINTIPAPTGETYYVEGTATGTSTVDGTLVKDIVLNGSTTGISSMSSTSYITESDVDGQSDGDSSVSGHAVVSHEGMYEGYGYGVSSVSGSISVHRVVSGSTSGISGINGSTTIDSVVDSSSTGTSTVNGSITLGKDASSSVDGTSTVSGVLNIHRKLGGTATGIASADGSSIYRARVLASVSTGTSGFTGRTVRSRHLSSSTSGNSTATGTVRLLGHLENPVTTGGKVHVHQAGITVVDSYDDNAVVIGTGRTGVSR